MNTENLSILAIITIIVIIVAVVFTQSPQTPSTLTKQPFFSRLANSLQEVDTITVTTPEESFSLVQGADKQWNVKEKHHYPATAEKVGQMLLGMADLTILEPKTSNPKLYAKLGVEDVTTETAQSVRITLKKQDKILADLLVGNNQLAKTDPTLREIYVRKPDEQQSWLVMGLLPEGKKPLDWVNKEIIDVASERLRQIEVTHANGEKLRVFKENLKDSNYQLANMPENTVLQSSFVLNPFGSLLSHVSMEDVVPAKSLDFPKEESTQAVFTTFDGLVVNLTTREQEGKHYTRFSVQFAPEAIVEEPEAPAAEGEESAKLAEAKANKRKQVEDEAKKLNAQLSDWVFVLPQYKVDTLVKKQADLVSVEVKTEDKMPTDELGTPTTMRDEMKIPKTLQKPLKMELGHPVTVH